jgi:hypothetical protein
MSDLIERLADAEHASWARWMEYLFSTCIPGPYGTLILQPENIEHWRRQIETPYADLSEREKQSDRDEVAHIMPFIEAALAESTARADRFAVEVSELRAAFIQHRTATHEVEPKFCKTCRESDAVLNRPADTRGAEILGAADEMAVAIDGLLTTPCVVEWPSGSESLARYRALGVVGEGARWSSR